MLAWYWNIDERIAANRFRAWKFGGKFHRLKAIAFGRIFNLPYCVVFSCRWKTGWLQCNMMYRICKTYVATTYCVRRLLISIMQIFRNDFEIVQKNRGKKKEKRISNVTRRIFHLSRESNSLCVCHFHFIHFPTNFHSHRRIIRMIWQSKLLALVLMNLVCHCRREIVQSTEMAVMLCVNRQTNHWNIFAQQLKHFTMSLDGFMQK